MGVSSNFLYLLLSLIIILKKQEFRDDNLRSMCLGYITYGVKNIPSFEFPAIKMQNMKMLI